MDKLNSELSLKDGYYWYIPDSGKREVIELIKNIDGEGEPMWLIYGELKKVEELDGRFIPIPSPEDCERMTLPDTISMDVLFDKDMNIVGMKRNFEKEKMEEEKSDV